MTSDGMVDLNGRKPFEQKEVALTENLYRPMAEAGKEGVVVWEKMAG